MTNESSAPQTIPASRPAGGSARWYFMCAPTYFAVTYRINPWMRPDEPADPGRAQWQWHRLRRTLLELGHHIELIKPQPALPDMVFAANGGIVIGDRALVPRFRHRERAAESVHFAMAFAAAGIAHVQQAEHINEGEGDFRVAGTHLLAGTGQRSAPAAVAEAAEYFDLPAVPLRLVDPRLYHLDTALAVLDDETIAYWPDAFDAEAQGLLRELYPDAILADRADAEALALNLISDGSSVVVSPAAGRLADALAERGYRIVRTDTSELLKAGGGAKCCVLERHQLDSQ